jgi:hypothetical protein
MSSNNVSSVSMFSLVTSGAKVVNTRVSWDGDTLPGKEKPQRCSVTIPGAHAGMTEVMAKLMAMPDNATLRVGGLKRTEGAFGLVTTTAFSPNSLIDLLLAVGVRQGSPLTDPRPNMGKDDEGKPEDMTEYSSNNATTELIALREEAKSLGIEPGRKAMNTLRKLIADHKASQHDHNANGAPVPA